MEKGIDDRPEHDSRGYSELEVRPDPLEGPGGEASPRLLAGGAEADVQPIQHDEEPPREAQREGRPDEPIVQHIDDDIAEDDVDEEHPDRHVGQWVDDVLSLEESLHRARDSKCVELRDEPPGEDLPLLGYALRLPHRLEDWSREPVEEGQQEGRSEVEDDRPLAYDAHCR